MNITLSSTVDLRGGICRVEPPQASTDKFKKPYKTHVILRIWLSEIDSIALAHATCAYKTNEKHQFNVWCSRCQSCDISEVHPSNRSSPKQQLDLSHLEFENKSKTTRPHDMHHNSSSPWRLMKYQIMTMNKKVVQTILHFRNTSKLMVLVSSLQKTQQT